MRKYLTRMTGVMAVVAMTVVAVAWLGSGCDNSGSGNFLTIDPAESRIGPNITQFTLAIVGGLRDLSEPIQWTVTNPGLGYVEHRGGTTAVYIRRGGTGQNIVVAKDQYDVEGFAAVDQVPEETAAPGTTQPGTTNGTTNVTAVLIRP